MDQESKSALLILGQQNSSCSFLPCKLMITSVDYTLAALGGGYGAGKKIAKGYDLVGNYDANGQPAPDSDPMDVITQSADLSA